MNAKEFTCIKQVVKTVKLDLPPMFISNEMAGVTEILDSWKRQYIHQLQGIVVSYKNVSLKARIGFVNFQSSSVLYNVKATFDLFCPNVGDIVKGKINRMSREHIGCLVQGTINVTIHLPRDLPAELSKRIYLESEILFEITHFAFERKVIHVTGDITPKCIQLMNDLLLLNEEESFENGPLFEANNAYSLEEDESTRDVVMGQINLSILNSTKASDSSDEVKKSKKSKKRRRESESSVSIDSPKKKKKHKEKDNAENSPKKKKLKSNHNTSLNVMSETDDNDPMLVDGDNFNHVSNDLFMLGEEESLRDVEMSQINLSILNSIKVSDTSNETKKSKKSKKQRSESESSVLTVSPKKKKKHKERDNEKKSPKKRKMKSLINDIDISNWNLSTEIVAIDPRLVSRNEAVKKEISSPQKLNASISALDINENKRKKKLTPLDGIEKVSKKEKKRKEKNSSANQKVSKSKEKKNSSKKKSKMIASGNVVKKDKKKSEKDKKSSEKEKSKLIASGDVIKKDKKKSGKDKKSSKKEKLKLIASGGVIKKDKKKSEKDKKSSKKEKKDGKSKHKIKKSHKKDKSKKHKLNTGIKTEDVLNS